MVDGPHNRQSPVDELFAIADRLDEAGRTDDADAIRIETARFREAVKTIANMANMGRFEVLSRDEAENAALFAAAELMGCKRSAATRLLTSNPQVWGQYRRAVRAAWKIVVRMRLRRAETALGMIDG